MIYLDNAATTYPKPECVLKALDQANRAAFNTSRGGYQVAREATRIIDETRKKILEWNHLTSGDVIFTSSATQALNNIIFGLDVTNGDHIYISPFEHNSIVRALEQLKPMVQIHRIPFDKETWDLEEEKLKNMFALNKPKAVLLSHVSNVTGYQLPIEKIFALTQEYHTINILDASQSFGVLKIPDVSHIHYIVFAGHKSLYASFGIAGFIQLKNTKLKQCIFGGTGSDTMNPYMPEKGFLAYEAGSPNMVAITGLHTSIDWLNSVDVEHHEKELTDYLIEELQKIPKVKLFIPTDYHKIFGVVSFGVNGYSADEVGKILDDEFSICVRTGFHCAPFVHEFIGSMMYQGTVRCSLSYFTTKEEIDTFIRAIKTL